MLFIAMISLEGYELLRLFEIHLKATNDKTKKQLSVLNPLMPGGNKKVTHT